MSDAYHNGESTAVASTTLSAVAVTGACGFMGGRLVEMLTDRGSDVTCFIRGRHAGKRLHHAGARIVPLDLTEAPAVQAAVRGKDVVFHLAYDWENEGWNRAAMATLIEACSMFKCRLVYVSSFVVYELPKEGTVTESSPRTPATDGYPALKLELETSLLAATRSGMLHGSVVQPTIEYGPYCGPWSGDPADKLRHGKFVLPDVGEGLCNAVYVDDVVSALLLAATRPEAIGQRYLISGPAPVTWGQFYGGLASSLELSGPIYQPAKKIKRTGTKFRKMLRVGSNPKHVIRKLASRGPSRRAIAFFLKPLPFGLGGKARRWLELPIAEWSGHVHWPTPGHMEFLQLKSVIVSTKAEREIGYRPLFTFEEGLGPTVAYLRRNYEQRAASVREI